VEENVSINEVKAIILEPTRELAIQVKAQFDKFSNLRTELVYGGDTPARVQSKPLTSF
jgi:superfamily II DNA/RNA helicase